MDIPLKQLPENLAKVEEVNQTVPEGKPVYTIHGIFRKGYSWFCGLDNILPATSEDNQKVRDSGCDEYVRDNVWKMLLKFSDTKPCIEQNFGF